MADMKKVYDGPIIINPYDRAVDSLSKVHTLFSVNDVTEGSTQEAHMCAS